MEVSPGDRPWALPKGPAMTAHTFTPTVITRPGEEPQNIDAGLLSIEEIEAIAYESPNGTTVSTRRGVFTCLRYDSGFSMWTSDGGNFADAFMVHVIITEYLPVV